MPSSPPSRSPWSRDPDEAKPRLDTLPLGFGGVSESGGTGAYSSVSDGFVFGWLNADGRIASNASEISEATASGGYRRSLVLRRPANRPIGTDLTLGRPAGDRAQSAPRGSEGRSTRYCRHA